MKSILSIIQECSEGIKDAKEELLIRMEPLLKKYASNIHFMDYEDALQEFYVELLAAIPHLASLSTEGKCLKYIMTVIKNCSSRLCKKYLGRPTTESLTFYEATLEASPTIDDSYYDVKAYINLFPPESIQHKILTYIFNDNKTDTEIPELLGVYRQYINRMRKKLINKYFSDYANRTE